MIDLSVDRLRSRSHSSVAIDSLKCTWNHSATCRPAFFCPTFAACHTFLQHPPDVAVQNWCVSFVTFERLDRHGKHNWPIQDSGRLLSCICLHYRAHERLSRSVRSFPALNESLSNDSPSISAYFPLHAFLNFPASIYFDRKKFPFSFWSNIFLRSKINSPILLVIHLRIRSSCVQLDQMIQRNEQTLFLSPAKIKQWNCNLTFPSNVLQTCLNEPISIYRDWLSHRHAILRTDSLIMSQDPAHSKWLSFVKLTRRLITKLFSFLNFFRRRCIVGKHK